MNRFFFILLIVFNYTSAQEATLLKVDSILKNHHVAKTITLHIHSNKTVYINDEKIWFSIYAFEKESSKITSENLNVVVQVVDNKNNILSKSLLYIDQGTADGSFTLSPKTKTNTYFIRAFKANNLHTKPLEIITKPIKIINPNESESRSVTNKLDLSYDVQVLPEGGHLVSNINNTCGVKIINPKGKGVQFDNLTLIDETGKLIKSNISTNRLGMGKFSFIPSQRRIYKIISSDNSISTELPQTKQKGVALKLEQDFKTGNLQIEITTNKHSLPYFSDQDITISIHKESLSNNYTTRFEKGFPKMILNIPNKKLFPGTNIITVFDKFLQPICERLFFNFQSINSNSSFITNSLKVKDTFSYRIINKVNNKPIGTNTSISVLPINTKANNHKDDLFASVYLKPFLSGSIENPTYYFEKNNNQKRFEIDLLMLNQGWSKYNWNHILNNESKNTITSKAGVTIKGYLVPLNKNKIVKKVLLYSKDNKAIQIADIKQGNTFLLESLVFESGSQFEFSAIDEKGKPIKANFFFTTNPLAKTLDSKLKITNYNPFNDSSFDIKKSLNEFEGEALDEVVIKANKLKFNKFTRDRYGIVVDSSLYGYGTIGNYFKAKEGLTTKLVVGDVRLPQGLFYFYRTTGEMAVFIVDGKLGTPTNGLLDISMEHVLEMYHGGRNDFGFRRSHVIFTDGKGFELPENQKTSKKFTLNNGFTFEKETYKPEYIDYESISYQNFGAVSWHYGVTSNIENYSNITFTNPGEHDLLFYIEGYTENGDPFSTITSLTDISNN